MPCNLNQRELSDAAAAAVDAAGGVALPVQHDRGLRQPVPGHAGDARVARLARGDRRLDRADGDRARLRRARLHRRLRQDDAGGADGARPDRQARGPALQRPAARRAPRRPRADDPRGLGGGRPRTQRGLLERGELDAIERAACPGAGHLRRAVHRQHDGGRARLPRAGRARRRADPRRGPRGEGGGRRARRAPGGRDRRTARRRARSSTAARCATRWPASRPAAARPTACCTCSRSRARRAWSSRRTS